MQLRAIPIAIIASMAAMAAAAQVGLDHLLPDVRALLHRPGRDLHRLLADRSRIE